MPRVCEDRRAQCFSYGICGPFDGSARVFASSGYVTPNVRASVAFAFILPLVARLTFVHRK